MQLEVGASLRRVSYDESWSASSGIRIVEKEVAPCSMWDLRALRSPLMRAQKPRSQAVREMRGFLRFYVGLERPEFWLDCRGKAGDREFRGDLVQQILVGLEIADRSGHRSARYVDAVDVGVILREVFF